LGKPPRSPYPPDLAEDATPAAEFGDLVDALVEDADWANRRASRLVMRRVELRRSRFTGAELGEAAMTDAAFLECRLDLVGLRIAKLERVIFHDCRMSDCDFYGASLKDVVFDHCNLREATFTSAKIERVDLIGCDLAGIRGIEALRGARMQWNDVLENAPLLASALGIEIID
jgi:uncharacterized protein YjbI with pentapeptide repeats